MNINSIIERNPLPENVGFDHLKSSYKTIALISSYQHFACIPAPFDETLIISSDWLLWQKLHDDGYDVVYLEQGYPNGHGTRQLSEDILLIANSWRELDGEDLSIFQKISLGEAFSSEIAYFLVTYYRISISLTTITNRFRPDRLLFYDVRYNGIWIMPDADRLWIVKKFASDNDLTLINNYQPTLRSDTDTQKPPSFISRVFRSLAIHTYETIVDRVSYFRRRRQHSTPIPLIVQSVNLFGEMAKQKPNHIKVMVPARLLPKSIRITFDFLRKGFLMPSLKNLKLSHNEHVQIDMMISNYENAWLTPADDFTEALRAYVKTNIFAKKRIHSVAVEIKSIYSLLNKWRPTRVVVDGIKNMPSYGYIACATQMNIPTDYIWHSPLTPLDLKYSSLGCDGGNVLISRILSWGKINEQWLLNKGASKIPCVPIGVPYLLKYKNKTNRPCTSNARRKALVVQYTTLGLDLGGSICQSYYHFISVIRVLKEKDYDNIIFKLHPGYIGAMTNFTAIAEYYGLKCQVLRFAPFDELVQSSDIAIGHLFSGSSLDIIASKTPFFAAMFCPADLNFDYFDGCNNFAQTLDGLIDNMKNDVLFESDEYLNTNFHQADATTCASNYWTAIAPPQS